MNSGLRPISGPPAPVTAIPSLAQAVGLVVTNGGAPASQVTITATEALLRHPASLLAVRHASVSVTADITVAGRNGLDTGAEANSTWYYIWLVSNGNVVAALLSTSSTAPTVPTGYSYRLLVGAVYNSSGGDFATFYQQGSMVWLNFTIIFTSKAAAAGDTYESYSAGGGGADVNLATVVPPNAKVLHGLFGAIQNAAGCAAIAAYGSGATGLGVQHYAGTVDASAVIDLFGGSNPVRVALKTPQTVYWKGNDTTARWRFAVTGFEL